MIEQLKAFYKKDFETSLNLENRDQFYWFLSQEGLFGISKKAIKQEHYELLKLLFTPYQNQPLEDTQLAPVRLLQESIQKLSIRPSFEFLQVVFFYFPHQQIEKKEVETLFYSYFPNNPRFIWKNSQEGYLILLQDKVLSKEEVQPILDLFKGDLFVDIRIHIGIPIHANELVFDSGNHPFEEFAFVQQIKRIPTTTSITQFIDIIPVLLFSYENQLTYRQYLLWYGHQLFSESETVTFLKKYLQSGLNVTKAAKELYLHRNTVQYRIDKWITQTGINIREFHDASHLYVFLNWYEETTKKG